jgi:glycerophosphoryl diester phosphodiesterase
VTWPTPLLLGHRGSPRVHRENTLESYQAALASGLHGVELDVQRTADGVLVVHHDFHLSDGRLIAALREKDVRSAELPMNGRVPTFDEVLDWASTSGAWLNVEIKSQGLQSDGRESETVNAIRRHRMRERTIISSFNPLSIARVRFFDRTIETALLYAEGPEPRWALEGGRSAPLLGVKAIHPRFSLVTPELVQRAHKRGWRVNVWTVNDEELAKRLLSWGVDGLIGDDPGTLLRAAGQPEKPAVAAV